MRKAFVLILCLLECSAKANENLIQLDYDGFSIGYNCEMRGYEWFYYITGPDTGNEERVSGFFQEERLPEHCRQFTTGTYQSPRGAEQYDRGHGVHQNVFDHDAQVMKATNTMANIIPHERSLNRRGAHRLTEKLTECWRDFGTMTVWGGVIWGSDTTNDYFLTSHGVTTPDFLWRAMQRYDGEIIAWIIPNASSSTAERLDEFLVPFQEIEQRAGVTFQGLEEAAKSIRLSASWPMPEGCSIK